MKKGIFTILILYLALTLSAKTAFAQSIPVKLTSAQKITTCDRTLQEGDSIKLVTTEDIFVNSKLLIKKGTETEGVITSLVDNYFASVPASIYAEQFRIKDVRGNILKLNGIVYKSGRSHWMFNQFLPITATIIRGGEAFILPNKDFYTLHLEVNNE